MLAVLVRPVSPRLAIQRHGSLAEGEKIGMPSRAQQAM